MQKINVLAVDDVEQNLTAIEALIASPTVNVLRASSGTEALELLLTQEVALALLDVQMPQMDGFELATLIRGSERTRSVPLIFLTAGAREPEKYFRGYDAGAVDFLYKPIDPNVLRSKVAIFVELHSQKIRLANQLEALRQALHLNEMFVAVLGHDLRNPLSAVSHGAALILRASDDDRVKATAVKIQSSTARMVKMVEQLLDVARIRAGGLQLDIRQVDFMALSSDIVGELDADAPGRVGMVASGDVRGQVDVDRFSQVISNLVGNALHHGAGDSPVRVNIDGSDPARILLSVGNAGVIPPEQMPHLFESFNAGPASRTSRQGLGLGLYIVRQFVIAHGGDVSVQSTAEAGTVFTVTLPRLASLSLP
ncbi:MAG: hybrid sensor histidine kinase/response regulator [Burkholderiaceae bacterium]|nr:hybrid sensor histidine kinase/response regulator [Burkholderiaceae bacterium]